ncbi:hypothetical protein KGA66_01970 [Actinocrinis puniceicyclus]|uniref:Uncharacterized protein n=1 Tax=Actinocrinis puniceicyclus TaxID=977794 RepID=A0A8J7WGL8_9ACTN|nr:hypothetical protein [Actinocrinis puniceicyclus]MBS2961798.1 hypothetical protein [Actinocrinis puniceicyclus]
MTTDAGLPEGAAAAVDPAAESAKAPETGWAAPSADQPPPALPPALPVQPIEPIDPAALEAARLQREQDAARRARRRRNALRWVGAVAVTMAVGGGTAFALTLPQRTDMPGLATAPDGRYAFPALTLPTLPAGQPAPSASANSMAQQHLADIRRLLLPRPTGAGAQGVKSAVDGWLADPSPLFVAQDSKSIFAEFGLRHTAAESWKTPDGATTTVYLLQFTDALASSAALTKLSNDDSTVDMTPSLSAALTGVPSNAPSHEINPYGGVDGDYTPVSSGGELTRYGTFRSGDIIAVVIESGPAKLSFAAFQQVMTLQAELLQ